MAMAARAVFLLTSVALVVGMLIASMVVVPPGSVAVVSFLGTLSPVPLFPGMAFVNPLSHVVVMNTQTQVLHFSANVPTLEGVNAHLEASCLYHMNPEKAAQVYEWFGSNIDNVLLVPQFESTIRETTSGHTAAALYTAASRQSMTNSLRKDLETAVTEYGIIIESTPINKLTLPIIITDAIEQKMQLQQEAEKMMFVLDRERQEAQRKVIEAAGIARAQRIIAANTTDAMLRWNAIQATAMLSTSCNSRLVLLGENGLPVIHPSPVAEAAKQPE
ncbi:Prohibitin-1 [Diplonema papillatum]|nr:Prohibitin-1 [Diplonema papillatum]